MTTPNTPAIAPLSAVELVKQRTLFDKWAGIEYRNASHYTVLEHDIGWSAWQAAVAQARLAAQPVVAKLLSAHEIECLWSQHAENAQPGSRRLAFGHAVEAEVLARAALTAPVAAQADTIEPSAPAGELRKSLMAVDGQLCAILNGTDGLVYDKLKAARNDLVRIWLPLGRTPAADAGSQSLRYTSDGALAQCPCCGSLDVGGAHNTVHCYACDLTIKRVGPLQNAMDAWNRRTGRAPATSAGEADTTEPSAGVAAAWALKQIADLDPKNGSIATAVFMAREGLATATSTGEADTTASVAGTLINEATTASVSKAPAEVLGYAIFRGGKHVYTERTKRQAESWIDAEIVPLVATAASVSQAVEQPADDAEDAARLDFLDTNVHRFRMGWEIGAAPVGNLSVRSIIMGGKPIREAIDAAMSATKQEGDK